MQQQEQRELSLHLLEILLEVEGMGRVEIPPS